jgi:hypothetical protein
MAVKAHHRSRRYRRLRRARNAVYGQWVLALLARTLASIVIALIARWLHLPT